MDLILLLIRNGSWSAILALILGSVVVMTDSIQCESCLLVKFHPFNNESYWCNQQKQKRTKRYALHGTSIILVLH